MSNPYKEIVEELASDRPHYTRTNEIGEMETHCFFCISRYTSKHMETCLWRRANQLLDQKPDIEKQNPWNPCSESEGLPKEDGVYIVTTKKGNIFYDEPFRNGEWWRFDKGDVIAWRNELKPYQPPVPKPPTPVAQPEKPPEPTPDPKLFEKPTPPPKKHQPPTLDWKRLSEELPTKPGEYFVFDEDLNQSETVRLVKGDFPCQRLERFEELFLYKTHWALVKEEG